MTKLGSKKRPIVVHVQNEQRAIYVAEICATNDWHYIIGIEPDNPEDISDLERMLDPTKPAISKTIVTEKTVGRNDPCPCGSGKKFKKCCGFNDSANFVA